MKTTAKNTTARKPSFRVHVTPTHAAVYSHNGKMMGRINNGVPGSDGAAQVNDMIERLKKTHNVIVQKFTAQGAEVKA